MNPEDMKDKVCDVCEETKRFDKVRKIYNGEGISLVCETCAGSGRMNEVLHADNG